ncbi:hypothetical protein [Brevibacterium renqingii]|nr:hypothetical protein [Brevibacterium renqingii]
MVGPSFESTLILLLFVIVAPILVRADDAGFLLAAEVPDRLEP